MSDILQYARAGKAFEEIKAALRDTGCDICDIEDLSDVSTAIKEQCVSGKHVFNMDLTGGPGIKVTPQSRKGYRISADDKALITEDLTNEIPRGSSIHKALHEIIYNIVPKAAKDAAYAPAVLAVDFIKAPYDGCDYYPVIGSNVPGRKTGLRPDEWYVRIALSSQSEPMYVCMGNVTTEMYNDILMKVMHHTDKKIDHVLSENGELQTIIDKKVQDAIRFALGAMQRPPHKPGCHPGLITRPPHKPFKPCPKPEIPGDDFDSDMNVDPIDPGYHGTGNNDEMPDDDFDNMEVTPQPSTGCDICDGIEFTKLMNEINE